MHDEAPQRQQTSIVRCPTDASASAHKMLTSIENFKGLDNKNDIVVLIVMAESYSSAAVWKILGVSQRCLDYWNQIDLVRPSLEAGAGKGSLRQYSFDDLLRLAVVKNLRQAGLSLQKIKKGVDRLKKRSPGNDPLLSELLITDGKNLHRVTKAAGAVEDVLAGGQLVFAVVAVGQIDRQLREKIIRLGRKIGRRGVPTGRNRHKTG